MQEKSKIINTILSLLAYGISLFIFYLQVSLSIDLSKPLPPQAMAFFSEILEIPHAILPIIRFFSFAIIIHLLPTFSILAAYRRDPKINQYSARQIITVGITYILLWHLLIAVINAILIPKSNWSIGIYYNTNWLMNLVLILGSAYILSSLFIRSINYRINKRFIIVSILFFSLPFFLSYNIQATQPTSQTSQTSKQNIIIIGVDSLSIQQYYAYKAYLPNIRQIMDKSVQFSDTVTPLGRTFTAWTSILSGKYPRETGARDNLTPLNLIDSSNFLPKVLQSAGYTTLYAIDERRFSNIDESWGFDKVIGPEVGAADFIISTMADIPIVNIIVAGWPWLGEQLFPFITYNRAISKTYFPQQFSDKLDTELSRIYTSPIFLSVHFCITHVPFTWGDVGITAPQDISPIVNKKHFNAVKASDTQVGRLIDTLKRSGYLNNAIVVLLSDHGEGLGYQARKFTAENHVPPADTSAHDFSRFEFIYGHGGNVNDPAMNQVILAVNQYIDNKPVSMPSIQKTPATLVDIMPTILDLSGLEFDVDRHLSGISLAPSMRKPSYNALARLRFLESGLSPIDLNAENPSHKNLFESMASLFTLTSTGKIELIIDDNYKKTLKSKKKAVISDKWQLTVYPPTDAANTLLLFNRETGQWTDNQDSPLWHEANADQLLEKLIEFFGVEEIDWK